MTDANSELLLALHNKYKAQYELLLFYRAQKGGDYNKRIEAAEREIVEIDKFFITLTSFTL